MVRNRARVTLNPSTHVPYDLDHDYFLSTPGKSATLAMRRSDSRFSITSTSDRAFCRLLNTASPAVERHNLSNPTTADMWTDQNADIDDGEQPAVISRAFGTERLFYVKNSALVDDILGTFTQATGTTSWPKLDAWKDEPQNVFLACRGTNADVIDVYQILP